MTTYTHSADGCDRCGTQEIEVTMNMNSKCFPKEPEKMEFLCCFCYQTMLGNVLDYPAQFPGQVTLVQGLIQALHIIKREIKENNK